MEKIVELVVCNGMSVVIIAYLLYKDYKFNDSIIKLLGELKDVMVMVKTVVTMERGGVIENE